jgi:hypothetical protein
MPALLAVLLGACGIDDSREIVYAHLFDRDFGLLAEAEPEVYWPGDDIEITARALPLHDGVGVCTVDAHSWQLANALWPVEGPVGRLSAPLEFSAGEVAELSWGLRILEDHDYIVIYFRMAYDSLRIDGELLPAESPEISERFGPLILKSIGGKIRVQKETP